MKFYTISPCRHLAYVVNNVIRATNPFLFPVNSAFKRKMIMRIKLTFIIIVTALLQVGATGFAQKINLSFKNASLEIVFKEIRKQSGYDFVYTLPLITEAKPINIEVSRGTLPQVLQLCFDKQPFTYEIVGRTVILKPLFQLDRAVPVQKTINITGTVVDEHRLPLPGATVRVKGTPKGAVTNEKGHFTILGVDPDATLVVSFTGYNIKEVKVNGERTPIIQLANNVKQLDAVVVATGIFKKSDQSFTGASTTVTAKELQQFGNRNLITSLRNIDPSFNIIESNSFGSNPNRLPEIQIRGNSSIPNVNQLQDQTRVGLNTPLIILDGFQSSLEKMLDINANEVESITMLKDASATAIYGSRGSNGVIVITTRVPKAGKLRLTYSSNFNLETPDLSGYSILNARDKLDLEVKAGYYNNARAENDLPLKRYYNYLLNEVNRGVDTYWPSIPLHNGLGQRHNLGLEGGDMTFRYSASAQINNIQGVMKGSSRNVFNGNVKLAYTYKNIKFKNDLQISQGNSANSPYGTFSDYVRMNPYWRAYDDNGNVLKLMGDPGNTDYSNRWNTLPVNPLYNATLNTYDKTNKSGILNNFMVEWAATQDLQVRAQFGITKTFTQSDAFRPAEHTAFANYTDINIFRKGDYNYGVENSLSYDGSLNFGYSKTFARKHTVFAGLDLNVRQDKGSNYGFLAEGFNNSNFDFLGSALQYAQGGKPTGNEFLSRAVGATANGNYIYDNRYFIDASIRLDGSSQFGTQKRFAPFWSTGLGWNLHNEKFLAGNRYVNRLKLRGSMGITGSQNFSSYQALSTYKYYTNDRYFNWNGAYLLGLGNENLKWQQAMKYDIGVDAEFFKSRLKLTADIYSETTNDLVSSVNLPASNGFGNYIENIGKMRNRGFEIKATAFVISKPERGLFWSITAAMIQNKNKVLQTSQALKDAQKAIQNAPGATPDILYAEGYSTNTIWVVPSLGIDPSTGKELYLSKSGQPTYTWSGNDLQAVGSTDPKYMGNFSTMVRYKTLSLNVSFGYRFGGQMYNQTLIDKVENANYQYNVDSRVYDSRWQKPGDQAAFKGLLITSLTNKTSRFVQNESTLNCQNINLQYDLRSPYLIKHLGLQALSFSANVADAFYISTVRRERGTAYPFSRQFSLSINTTF